MKSILVLTALFVVTGLNSVFSQYFTIEDIEMGRNSYLKPGSISNLQWGGGANEVVYSKGDTLFSFSPETQKEQVLLLREDLNEHLKLTEEMQFNVLPRFQFISEDQVYIINGTRRIIYSLADKSFRVLQIPGEAENRQLKKPQGDVAYLLDNNVFIVDSEGKAQQLSFDSLDGIRNGDVPYRNEFGIAQGMFWSPDARYLAYYHRDERQVGQYPIVDISTPVASLISDRYPMAGKTIEDTKIHIYDSKQKTQVVVDAPTGSGVYLTNLSWTPDGKFIYLQHLNRGQDTMVLRSYSSATGEFVAELFMETHPKYVEPLNPIHFLEKIPGDFLYLSERSGYNQLYHYSAGKAKLEPLTRGEWDITELLGTDLSERYVFFMAARESPLESHLYQFDRKTQDIEKLTRNKGTHTITFNKNKTLFIDQYSSMDMPAVITICDAEGKTIKELLSAPNPVKDFKLGQVEMGIIKGGDDESDIYYKLTKPVNFDPQKKYPLILYVYGGPHVQLITDSWMDRLDYLYQFLAQQGYASLVIDSRGSDNRGRVFEDVIFRQHGVPQLEDNMKAIEFISTNPWIDTSRIGVSGWSYGGFMTINLMLNHPETFKVAVAGGAVTNWELYEVMYGERYMDTPEENPEGYEKTNLINQAHKLEGKLMLIHGGLDDVVVWQNSLAFIQACIKLDKQVDMFVYPQHEHNVIGEDRVHLTRMLTQYFIDNL